MELREGVVVPRRPVSGRPLNEFPIVPKELDLDVLATVLPKDVEVSLPRFMGVPFLHGLIPVTFRRYDVMTATGGWMPVAQIETNGAPLTPVVVRIDNALEDLRRVDGDAWSEEVNLQRVDAEFLRTLSAMAGIGTTMPKRLYATPVVFEVKRGDEEPKPILVNIAEAWYWLARNPGAVKEVVVMPTYKLAVLVTAEPVDEKEFVHDVVMRRDVATRMFWRETVRTRVLAAGLEQEQTAPTD